MDVRYVFLHPSASHIAGFRYTEPENKTGNVRMFPAFIKKKRSFSNSMEVEGPSSYVL